jgi:hypothetical protein
LIFTVPRSLLLAAALVCPLIAGTPIGVFEGQTGVGRLQVPGGSSFGSNGTFYTVTSAGEKIWGTSDDFHFVWKKAKGDVAISAEILFDSASGDPYKKAVLMFRQSLAADSPYADAALHLNGLASLQARLSPGARTYEIRANAKGPSRLKLEKRGDYFFLYTAKGNEAFEFTGAAIRLPLQEPFYVGIGTCAAKKDALETAAFSNLSVRSLARARTTRARSTLETIHVETATRRALVAFDERVTAPSWTANGDIVYKRGERYERLQPSTIEPAPKDRPKPAYKYYASRQTGSWQIWRSRLDGSGAEQMTNDGTENVAPKLSPDGKMLAFLSYPKGTELPAEDTEAKLRVLRLETGAAPVFLARFVAGKYSLAEPAWSPHGSRLAFVSYSFLP